MKAMIKAFLHWEKYSWEDKPRYALYSCDMTGMGIDRALIWQKEIEVEVPDNFDPNPQIIELLKKEKETILAQAHVKAQNIEDQIQRLICIEHKPDAQP